MNDKIGRNDPCPCGSGKKYKQCCGNAAATAPQSADPHAGGVESAIAWLSQHHRKAWAKAMTSAIDDAVSGIFDDEEQARKALAGMDQALWTQVQLNLIEWLLAEGFIQVTGESRPVAELLLGPRGPLLTIGQRAWIEQLARRPLRLYDVTEVVGGVGITLCDALDTAQPPLRVTERSGSRTLRVGMQIGARVMEVAGQHQLSGAIYPFSVWGGRAVQDRLRALMAGTRADNQAGISMLGHEIIEGWLQQYLVPAPLPQMVYGATGEPLLLVTEHYDVLDWEALTAALAAQPDVQGDRANGWDRLLDGADGSTRSQARITAAPRGRRVSVLYQTAGLAEQGRVWFDALAGEAVKFRLRDVSDPKGMLSRAGASGPPAAKTQALPQGLDAETLAGVIETVIKRTYANWADEPIPMLDGQTPRQAMLSEAGLERVKGLLRSYEDGESWQAAQQGRREVSYQFLWDVLGLTR